MTSSGFLVSRRLHRLRHPAPALAAIGIEASGPGMKSVLDHFVQVIMVPDGVSSAESWRMRQDRQQARSMTGNSG